MTLLAPNLATSRSSTVAFGSAVGPPRMIDLLHALRRHRLGIAVLTPVGGDEEQRPPKYADASGDAASASG